MEQPHLQTAPSSWMQQFVVTQRWRQRDGAIHPATGTSTNTIIQLQLPTAAAIPAKRDGAGLHGNLNASRSTGRVSPTVLAVPASVIPPPATPGVAAVPAAPIAAFTEPH
jgi:hypothetical protein